MFHKIVNIFHHRALTVTLTAVIICLLFCLNQVNSVLIKKMQRSLFHLRLHSVSLEQPKTRPRSTLYSSAVLTTQQHHIHNFTVSQCSLSVHCLCWYLKYEVPGIHWSIHSFRFPGGDVTVRDLHKTRRKKERLFILQQS